MKKSFHQRPSRNETWVTAGIAARLTQHTEKEVLSAANDPANEITSKFVDIGQRSYFLIDRNEIIAHFQRTAVAS